MNHSNLRSFQYLLLQNAVVTNKKLKQYKIRTDDKCTFCNSACEMILHLLYNCTYTQAFYLDVIKRVKEFVLFSCINELPDAKLIILNTIHPNVNQIENFLFLIGKYHVYHKSCAGLLPNVNMFKSEIIFIRKIEKFNATKAGNIDKHYAKWNNTNTISTSNYVIM